MNQKKFVNIVIIGIAVAILLGIAGYFVLVKEPTDKGIAECAQKTGGERNQCFRDLAIARKDSNLCESAGELKGVCLRYIAIFIKKDLSLCEKIPSDSLGASKEECRKTILSQVPETKEMCLKQGGTWGKIGPKPVEECNLRTSDAGKICTDYSQCEGSCIGESINSTAGKCSEWRITVGCHAFLQNGKVPGILCAD